jgi:esterase
MQLHFKSFGSGQPIIILHGMLGMLDNWQSFGKDLSRDYLVYLIDQRNHGKSGWNDYMDYPSMAEDLKETMESQWMYEGAVVIGHSMGGKTAMQLALLHPELVKALIVIDIAPVEYPGGHEEILQALKEVPVEKITDRQQVFDQLSAKIGNPAIVQFLIKNLSRNKQGGYQWKLNLVAIEANYHHLLAVPKYHGYPYQGPALFVRGAQSDYIAPPGEQRIREWFAKGRIATIAEAGHWVHADAPAVFKDTIDQFLIDSGLGT